MRRLRSIVYPFTCVATLLAAPFPALATHYPPYGMLDRSQASSPDMTPLIGTRSIFFGEPTAALAIDTTRPQTPPPKIDADLLAPSTEGVASPLVNAVSMEETKFGTWTVSDFFEFWLLEGLVYLDSHAGAASVGALRGQFLKAVPEPGNGTLLLSALLAGGAIAWRRRDAPH